jgi:transcriptional regulator with XRE-family HTH domain
VSGKVPKELKRKSGTPAEALGAVITELRLQKGWSTHYVTSRVRCDPSYMNAIEHGRQNPSLELVQAIADLHQIKLSRLIAMGERRYERSSQKKTAADKPAKKLK